MTYLEELHETHKETRARIEDAGRCYQARMAREKRVMVATEVEAWQKRAADALAEKTRLRRQVAWERIDRAMEFIMGPARQITMLEILQQTAKKHGVPVDDILSNRRSVRMVLARREAIYRCRVETPNSLPMIGRFFNRDHSTVHYACRIYAARLAALRSEG